MPLQSAECGTFEDNSVSVSKMPQYVNGLEDECPYIGQDEHTKLFRVLAFLLVKFQVQDEDVKGIFYIHLNNMEWLVLNVVYQAKSSINMNWDIPV